MLLCSFPLLLAKKYSVLRQAARTDAPAEPPSLASYGRPESLLEIRLCVWQNLISSNLFFSVANPFRPACYSRYFIK